MYLFFDALALVELTQMWFHKMLLLIYPMVVFGSEENEKLTYYQGIERGLRKKTAENQRRFPEIRMWALQT